MTERASSDGAWPSHGLGVDVGAILHALGYGLGCIGLVVLTPGDWYLGVESFVLVRPIAAAGCVGASVLAISGWPPRPELRSGVLRRVVWLFALAVGLMLASREPRWALLSWVPLWVVDAPPRPRARAVVPWPCLGPVYLGLLLVAGWIADARVEPLLGPPAVVPTFLAVVGCETSPSPPPPSASAAPASPVVDPTPPTPAPDPALERERGPCPGRWVWADMSSAPPECHAFDVGDTVAVQWTTADLRGGDLVPATEVVARDGAYVCLATPFEKRPGTTTVLVWRPPADAPPGCRMTLVMSTPR